MKTSFWERPSPSVEVCRISGNAMPAQALSRSIFLALLVLAGTLTTTQMAMADSFTFAFSGGGISGSGVLTVSPTGTPGTDTITGISGFFSDTNASANFSGAITGLEFAPPPSSPLPSPLLLLQQDLGSRMTTCSIRTETHPWYALLRRPVAPRVIHLMVACSTFMAWRLTWRGDTRSISGVMAWFLGLA